MDRKLKKLIEQRRKLEIAFANMRDEILRTCGVGRHDQGTVYTVRETWVKRHKRKGYTAVRLNYNHWR